MKARFLPPVLALLASPASAQEMGRITAFLDGDERVWHTITMQQSGKAIATATLRQSSHLAELQLQGHPEPRFTSKEVLSIDIRFPGRYTPGTEPMSVEILYTPNGLSGPLWISRGAPSQPRLQIVEFDVWGGVGKLVAVVSGEICKRPRLFSRTDTSDCKRLSVTVDTRLDVQ